MPQLFQLPTVVWSQFLWLAIGLGFIFFVIARGMVPKIQATVAAREQQIAGDIEAAQKAREAADQTEAAWRTRMEVTRADAARIAQEAKAESARETEARVTEAAGRINARLESSASAVHEALAAARAQIEFVATEAAQEMVQRLTGIAVDTKAAAAAAKGAMNG